MRAIVLKASVNSGAALFIFLGAFFLLVVGAALFPGVERVFTVAAPTLAGAFGIHLAKRASNNRIYSEEVKAGVTPPIGFE